MRTVIVIGAGPAGMMAAAAAARAGARVMLLEKMSRVGCKLQLTGNGRCNVTAAADREQLIKAFPGNGRFLHSAFQTLSSEGLMAFFEGLGVPLKVEADGRVFPASERAEDVIAALYENARKAGAQVLLSTTVQRIEFREGRVTGVRTDEGIMPARAVIIATGGKSYPGTGSTGDGYAWAAAAGHHIVTPRPGLVPLIAAEPWTRYMQGLSLTGVLARATDDRRRVISQGSGDLIFTHYGLSGPLILGISKDIARYLHEKGGPVLLRIDCLPGQSGEELDWQLQKLISSNSRKLLRNALGEMLPPRQAATLLEQAGIEDSRVCHQASRAERLALIGTIKGLELRITGTRPLAEAIVTAGGVDVKEVDPRTMESKKMRGLYFAGELLDIDGYTGGYNLQAAFSTGYAAGLHAARAAKRG